MVRNSKGRTTKNTPRNRRENPHLVQAYRDGYLSALRNDPHPFSSMAYECGPSWYQKNFERGRLIALNIRSAGLPLPAWPKTVGYPTTLSVATRTARDMVGNAVPLKAA